MTAPSIDQPLPWPVNLTRYLGDAAHRMASGEAVDVVPLALTVERCKREAPTDAHRRYAEEMTNAVRALYDGDSERAAAIIVSATWL